MFGKNNKHKALFTKEAFPQVLYAFREGHITQKITIRFSRLRLQLDVSELLVYVFSTVGDKITFSVCKINSFSNPPTWITIQNITQEDLFTNPFSQTF